MPSVLITGVNGFIGSHLAEWCLCNDWSVKGLGRNTKTNIDNKHFVYLGRGIESLSAMQMTGIDYVFHLAFANSIEKSINQPVQTAENNIGYMIRLLELCRKVGVKKLVFASSASLYGHNPIPWNEDMQPDPIEPYSWQKLSCEYACRMWARRYGLSTISLRLFQVFGERQKPDRAIPMFINAKQRQQPITLTNAGSECAPRSFARDFVYVRDVVDSFIRAAQSTTIGLGEVINIGSGTATTMEEIARNLGGSITWISSRHYEVEIHQASVQKARQLLGWQSTTKVLEWLKSNSVGQ